jgi:hypothetical protein
MKYILVLILATHGPSVEIINAAFDTELECKNIGLSLKIKYPSRIVSYHCKGFPLEMFEEFNGPDLDGLDLG